ncbi:LodA/GoxA family CTQ-dependent oxidase [uncultured Roseibium sp.]|uniref:LodA/GoxA family CTQ-dependent oxidase n=1 Tax=uncultured Roseibium sp. TaxID=1936171 RepID=UPI002633B4C6|nr:LodA/GoxA family CTQ-dependent oxidase [uncultured Roseibium sp.]
MIFRVHPAVGMARVGNSEEFYLGPETMAGLPLGTGEKTGGIPIRPGTESDTITSSELRDNTGAFKRQAARFKIFQYPETGSESYPTGQGTEIKIGSKVDGKTVTNIVWTVHVANKKANTFKTENNRLAPDDLIIAGYENGKLPPIRNAPGGTQPTDPLSVLNDPTRVSKLTIDPGPRTISGKNTAKVGIDKVTGASWWDGSAVAPLPNYPKVFPDDSFAKLDCPVGPIDTLGEMQTDSDGRLLVVGAYGRACAWYDEQGKPYPLDDFVDNNGWFDDTADGPVSAALVFDDQSTAEVQGAWVVSTDPSYAPQTLNVVSLWDEFYDTFVRELDLVPDLYASGSFNSAYKPAFPDQIQPIFVAASLQQWNTNLPSFAAGAHDSVGGITATEDPGSTPVAGLNIIRDPNVTGQSSDTHKMPLSLGDQGQSFLSLSLTQYFILQQWNAKNFSAAAGPDLGPGEALDKAILVNCLGGRFSPGIDMTFIVRQPDLYIRNWQTSGSGPFRIKAKTLGYTNAKTGTPLLTEGYVPLHTGNEGLEPGDTSKFMALPWHTDYNSCATHTPSPAPNASRMLYWSWPAQRPVAVYAAKDVSGGNLGDQRFSVRGDGTGSDNPADQGRYQDSLNMVKNFHKIGVILQGTSIDASDGGPFKAGHYLEVQSQLGDGGNKVQPFPQKANPK